DGSGNFLAAMNVLGADQTYGRPAIYSIDTVNGGQPLSSSTNTISGVIPGVTLDLKTASASPVTVTIAPDTAAITNQLQQFVDAFNKALDAISTQTKYDPTTRTGGPLSGDSALLGIARMLRS